MEEYTYFFARILISYTKKTDEYRLNYHQNIWKLHYTCIMQRGEVKGDSC